MENDYNEYHYKLDELFGLIDTYNDNIIQLKTYLKESNIDRIKTYLINDEKERARKRGITGAYKNEILLNEEKIKNVNQIINNGCTFDYKKLLNFLSEVISIEEEETYIITSVTTTDLNDEHSNNIKNIFNNKMSFNYYVVAPYDKIKKISELKLSDSKITYDMVLNILSGSKFIILEKSKKYNVYDKYNKCINSEITRCFPYLKNIFMDIVTAKLNGLNDENEIFESYINGLKHSYTDNLSYENIIDKSK